MLVGVYKVRGAVLGGLGTEQTLYARMGAERARWGSGRFVAERTKRPLVCNRHSGGYETISSFSKHRKGVTRFVRYLPECGEFMRECGVCGRSGLK